MENLYVTLPQKTQKSKKKGLISGEILIFQDI